MPAPTTRGTIIPLPTESPALPAALEAYDRSLVPHVRCASELAANKARSDYAAEGGQGPMFILRTDVRTEMVCWHVEDADEPIEYIGGRQHGATVSLRGMVPDGGSVGTPLTVVDWPRPGPGFGLSSDGTAIVIPETGFYNLSWTASYAGTAADLGRVFGEVWLRSANVQLGRVPGMNENALSGNPGVPLGKGQEVQFRFYHATGGAREVSATVNIYQTAGAGPNWGAAAR